MAKSLSERSSCLWVRTGCVIVDRQFESVVSTGYNGTIRDKMECTDIGRCRKESTGECRGLQAEANALIYMPSYAKYCDVFIYNEDVNTGEIIFKIPDFECVKMLVNACVYKIYIAHPTEDYVTFTIDDLCSATGVYFD